MKEVIEREKLDHLGVAKKCICKNKNDWDVVVHSSGSHDRSKRISLKEIEQLYFLLEKTRYRDLHQDNFVRDSHDKIIIIDTEDRSFGNYYSLVHLLKTCFVGNQVDEDARVWLNYMNVHENKNRETVILSENEEYDDPEIDFKQVKKEFVEMKQEKLFRKK